MSRSSERAKRTALVAARGACELLAPLSIDRLRHLGRLAGDAAWRADLRAVRTTRANIDIAFSRHDRAWRRHLAQASIRHTATTVMEAAALWTWPLPRLATLLRDVSGEDLLRPRAPGRGVLVLVPHFGNWEYMGYYLNTVAPLTPLYERPASAAVDQTLRAARARLGHRSAATSVAGLRNVLKSLKTGGMVAVLPDQVPTTGGAVAAPFFGRPAITMTLVWKLLRHSDADVRIAAVRRVCGGFAIRVDAIAESIRDPDPATSARAMNAAIETVVATDPAQYQWEYKRYRVPGHPNMYR